MRDPFIQRWAEKLHTPPLFVEDWYDILEEFRDEVQEKTMGKETSESSIETIPGLSGKLPGSDTEREDSSPRCYDSVPPVRGGVPGRER